MLPSVSIDIIPGDVPNCFNIDGRGGIPVAVLGSDVLDVTQIDANTLLFEGLHVRIVGRRGRGRLLCSVEDVSGDFTNPEGAPDGHLDLVCLFDDEGYLTGDGVIGVLYGELQNGTSIEGWDSICLLP